MIYTHVLNRGGMAVRSPLDGVGATTIRRQADEMGIPATALAVHNKRRRLIANADEPPFGTGPSLVSSRT